MCHPFPQELHRNIGRFGLVLSLLHWAHVNRLVAGDILIEGSDVIRQQAHGDACKAGKDRAGSNHRLNERVLYGRFIPSQDEHYILFARVSNLRVLPGCRLY